MAYSKKLALPWDTLITSLATDQFFPVGDFEESAGGLGNCRAWMEMQCRFGNAVAVPAYQTANDKSLPDNAIAIPVIPQAGGASGYASANGVYYPDPGAAMIVVGKTLLRVGWLIKSTSGICAARVSGTIQIFF